MVWGKLTCAGLMAAVSMTPAPAQEAEERYADLIHADLPLYGARDEKWPKAFADEDGSFGCASRIRYGDWALRDGGDDDEPYWYRFSNYGVFHCYAVIREAAERRDLDGASFEYGFFVSIGKARVDGRQIELWTLQVGGRPGSDYLLLAREPAKGMVTRFDVLQRKCPRARVRDSGGIDILSTRYCAINSKRELVALAKAMARLKPLGTLTVEREEADEPDPKPDPSKS